MADPALDLGAIQRELHGLGLTVKGFCKRAGVNPSTWHRLKSGTFESRRETERRIMAALTQVRIEHASKLQNKDPPVEGARTG